VHSASICIFKIISCVSDKENELTHWLLDY
jgi:hypothetical protein